MPNPDLKGDDRAARRGYAAAIFASALGHAAFFALVLVILPRYLSSGTRIPPAYTVKIVDQLPAGQLGTHLPPLSGSKPHAHARHAAQQEEAKPRPVTPITEPPPENDKNVIALNTRHQSTPTPTPTPASTPAPTPAPAATPEVTPTPEATSTPSPSPSATRLRKKRLTAKPTPTPKRAQRPKSKPTPAVQIAKAEHAPSVKQQLDKLRERLLAEHLAAESKKAREQGTSANAQPTAGETAGGGGGLLVGKAEIGGPGAGIGPGSGSMGIQQDLDFLLYYRQVQEKIKKAWSFSGGNSDLNTTVTFAIGPDGTLTGVKITSSSHDPAFDDSVVRAIRRAAPFTPPPEKYRSQFAEGIEAVFKLGELSSTG